MDDVIGFLGQISGQVEQQWCGFSKNHRGAIELNITRLGIHLIVLNSGFRIQVLRNSSTSGFSHVMSIASLPAVICQSMSMDTSSLSTLTAHVCGARFVNVAKHFVS